MVTNIFLFVDGSCAAKDDIGAWAAVAVMGVHRQVLYGAMYPSTISRCELTPIIEGIRWIKSNWGMAPNIEIYVYSDSEYTVKTLSGINQRHKNNELWKALDEAVLGLKIRYIWRSRNSLFYMSVCDAICGRLRAETYKTIAATLGDPRCPINAIPEGELPDVDDNQLIEKGDT
jgi:ribonuclease HI